MTPKCRGILGWEGLGTIPPSAGWEWGENHGKREKNSIPVRFWGKMGIFWEENQGSGEENGNFGGNFHLLFVVVFNGYKRREKNHGKYKEEEFDKENEEFWNIPQPQSPNLSVSLEFLK